MKEIEELPLQGSRVLVHANLDVPIDNQEILDDTRLQADLDTYRYLLSQECQVIVCGHLGRPGGKKDAKLSLEPVAKRIQELLEYPVHFIEDIETASEQLMSTPRPSLTVLENLRFYPGQEEATVEFAQQLASLADYYVNDDYISSHRTSATNILLPKLLPSARGYALKREWIFVRHVIENPAHPFVLIVGGAKPDKIGVINHLMGVADHIIVGGVLANTFLKASGVDVQGSKYDERSVEIAGEFLRDAEEKFLLPVDVVVANKFSADASHSEVSVHEIPNGQIIMDIGSQTIMRYKDVLSTANMIVWGGPIGVAEFEAFSRGTQEMAQCIGETEAYSLVAGGDSGSILHQLGLASMVNHISIGGGATLQLISGEELPAIEALSEDEEPQANE